MIRQAWTLLAWLQCVALLAVVRRLAWSVLNRRALADCRHADIAERVTVIVPVLNEQARLAPCLEGLIQSGDEVAEILVVDGGSTDRTAQLVLAYAARDARVQLVSAASIPHGWNGKSWGLEAGWQARSRSASWVLTVDADVRPSPNMVRTLLATAQRDNLQAVSLAPIQALGGDRLSWLLHPAMLTSLVYRFGIPGTTVHRPAVVLANGQVMLLHEHLLDGIGGFAAVATANAEDVALARRIVADGRPFGFFEAREAASVKMYRSGVEVWRGWPRSLALADGQSRLRTNLQLSLLMLAQGLPLPICLLKLFGRALPRPLFEVNLALLAVRLGVLAGTRRAYLNRRWWYWLSPLADLPVLIEIWRRAAKRRHRWRGRTIVVGGLR
uniref:Glycosyltransferase n=1 Tax=Thermorudis peleae TaxID=1382356 RepID=A0A831TKT9_9BACT